MKRDSIFLAIEFVLAIAVITLGANNQKKSDNTSAYESPIETTKNMEEDDFVSEKNELLSELDNPAFPLPPKLEEMGSMQNLPDLSSITIEAYPNTVASDELAENTIEGMFSEDTGLSGSSINDDWVKNYADTTAETVDEFRQKTKEYWQELCNITYHKRIQNQILDQVVKDTNFTLSQEMEDYGYKAALWQFANDAKNSGQSIQEALQQYNDFTNLRDVRELKLHFKLEGERIAKQILLLRYIAHTQGIEVSDAMIDQYAHELNVIYTPVYKCVIKSYTRDMLINTYGSDLVNFEVLNDATLKYMESQVKVTEIPEETRAVPEETETDEADIASPGWNSDYSSGSQRSNVDRFVYVGGSSINTEDYDDPDDFAYDWADENEDEYDSYDDALEDAYDIWSDERGDD